MRSRTERSGWGSGAIVGCVAMFAAGCVDLSVSVTASDDGSSGEPGSESSATDGATSGATTTGTTGPAPTTTTTTSTTGNPGTTGSTGMDATGLIDECLMCVEDNCPDEFADCQADADCMCLFGCVGQGGDIMGCGAQCGVMGLSPVLTAVAICAQGSCQTQCGF